MLKIIPQEKHAILANENEATHAALNLRFAADNAIIVSYSDIIALFRDLTKRTKSMKDGKESFSESTLDVLNKKLKKLDGVYLEIAVKEFGAKE